MLINNFIGGISNKLSSHLIGDTECVYLENADISTGIITSSNTLQKYTYSKDKVIVYNKTTFFLPENTVYTTIGDIVYTTNSKCIQKLFQDGSQYNVIIEGPTSAIEVSSKSTGGEVVGKVKYCYTYYSNKDGSESAPSPFSALATIGNGETDAGSVILSGIIASSDPQVTNILIYRLGHTLTEYSLVMTIPNQNSSVIDIVSDSSATTKLSTYGYNVSTDKKSGPYNTTFITNYSGALFTVCKDDTKVYHSVEGRPDLWGESYILFDEEVVALSPVSVGLLVACRTKTYICYGNINSFTKQLLLPSVGCSGNSMVGTPIGTIWLYNSTIWNFYQNAVELSKLKLKVNGTCISCCATETCAYFLLDTGKILVINYSLGNKYYYLDAEGITSIAIFDGNLVLNDGEYLYRLDGANATFVYISKKYTEGMLTMYKNYKTIYVYAEGNIQCKVYIDNNLVADTKLLDGLTEVKVDQTQRTGYSIWFEFTGEGSIYEIQWIAERRQNGR